MTIDVSANESNERTGGFDPKHFDQLAELEDKSFWFRGRNNLILWGIRRYSPELAGKFLEIGCGTGFVLQALSKSFADLELCGSELYEDGLEYARQRIPKAQFISLDATDMSFKSEFDFIGAFDVLEHIQEDELTIKAISTALKPGALFFISVPQHPWLWSQADEDWCHCRRYDWKDLETKLTASGFSIIRSTSFMFFLLPFMLLARRLPAKKTEETDYLAQLKMPTFLSWIFEVALSIELLLIGLGIDFPIGSSRFVVAKK